MTDPAGDPLIRGWAVIRRVYRVWAFAVNPATLLAMLLLALATPAVGSDPGRMDRARQDEDALGRWTAALERGEFVEVEAGLAEAGEVATRDPRWLNLWGLALAGQGRFRAAVSRYEAGLRRGPERAELHRNLAVALVGLGVRGRALSEFRQATELDPSDARAWYGLARLQGDLHRHAASVQSLKVLESIAGTEPSTWRLIAELADARSDSAGSWRGWTWVEAHDPGPDSARKLGDLTLAASGEGALEHYLDCVDRDPSATDCREAVTRLALVSGQLGLAIETSEGQVRELSQPGYFNLLLSSYRAQEFAKIEEFIGQRIPESAAGWSVVASGRREAGDVGGALKAVRSGLALAESADLYNLLGVLRVEEGDRAGARRAWRKALELDPDYAPARENLHEHPKLR